MLSCCATKNSRFSGSGHRMLQLRSACSAWWLAAVGVRPVGPAPGTWCRASPSPRTGSRTRCCKSAPAQWVRVIQDGRATCLRYYLLARSLLALPQQDQSSQDIRWHLQQLSSNQKFHETVIQIIALNRVRLIKKDFDRCSAQAKPTSCRSVSLVLLLFAQRPNVLRYSPHRGPGRIQTTAAQSQQRNSGQTWLEKVVEMWQVLLWFSCFVRVNSRKTTCTVGPRNSRKLASLSCSHTNIKCQCCIMPRYESSTCLFKN